MEATATAEPKPPSAAAAARAAAAAEVSPSTSSDSLQRCKQLLEDISTLQEETDEVLSLCSGAPPPLLGGPQRESGGP